MNYTEFVDFMQRVCQILMLMRKDNRSPHDLRELHIQESSSSFAEGSVEVSYGLTKVLCTASVENSKPKWISKQGHGWLTAEYNMLPRSTSQRTRRDKVQSSGRTKEISRLIGRSLRACINLNELGERQIYIDCDVLQADGGTRVASVTGGFVALALALKKLTAQNVISKNPLLFYVAGVSAGVLDGEVLLDLNYEEDQKCFTDMNLVIASKDKALVEIQATAEQALFTKEQINTTIELAGRQVDSIFKKQSECIGEFFPLPT